MADARQRQELKEQRKLWRTILLCILGTVWVARNYIEVLKEKLNTNSMRIRCLQLYFCVQ